MLFNYGLNFNEVPEWQKRGIGIYWKTVEKEGVNLKTGKKTMVARRELFTDYELPVRDEYNDFIEQLITNSERRI